MDPENNPPVPRGPECSICQEIFKDPKVLPCGHSFCLHCLIVLAPPGTRTIKCPLCQRDVDIPDGDVRKLATNFDLRDAVDGIDGRNGGGDVLNERPNHEGEGEGQKPEEKSRRLWRNIAIGGGAALSGVAVAAAVPFVILPAIGFTSGGIAAGSIAAWMMSSSAITSGGGVAAGSAVAVCQSIGAAGLAGSTYAAAGAAAGGVGFAAAQVSDKFKNKGGEGGGGGGDDGRQGGVGGCGDVADGRVGTERAAEADGTVGGMDGNDGTEVGLPLGPAENRSGCSNSEAESKVTIQKEHTK